MFNFFKYLTSNQDKSRLIYHYNEVAAQTTFSKQHCYDKKITYDITQLQKSSALNPPKIWTTNAMMTLLRKQRLQTDCRAVALWVFAWASSPLSTLLSAPKTDSQLNNLDRSSRESYLAVNPKISNYVKMVKSWSKLRGRLPLSLLTLLSAPQTPPPSSRAPSPSWRLCPRLSEVIIATVQILSSAKVWAVDK